MTSLRNEKGLVLITTYTVVLALLALSAVFFSRTVNEQRLTRRQDDSIKAFYNAEKAVAYAYFESANEGWGWFTHTWDNETGHCNSNTLSVSDALRTQGGGVEEDSYFITSGQNKGAYAAKDGSFILKTFVDPQDSNVTVVRAKGMHGNVERVIEYRISRRAIFDFAWWTPYRLYIANIGSNVNGGRIHSNEYIYMHNSKRLYGVDTISTGRDKSIYYSESNDYAAPGYFDWYMDGSGNINGEIPLPHLDTSRRWAGTTDAEPYGTQHPWKYYDDEREQWRWRWYGKDYAGVWPPTSWRDEEFYFYGDSQEHNNQTVGEKELNYYNTWIYPALKDTDGDLIFDEDGNVMLELPEEIPAELEGAMWDWEKYNNYGKFGGNPQQPVRFTVYDPDNPETPKYVEDTRWKIDAAEVVMTDLSDPAGVTYWQMLQDYNYWKALGHSDDSAYQWSTHINPEISDGTYGSEFAVGQTTIEIDNTNSMKQQGAWNEFLQESGLEDVILANERGEDMEPPRFATAYKEKSKKAGLYFSKSEDEGGSYNYSLRFGNGNIVSYNANVCGAYADYSDPQDYWNCVEASIDVLVDRLNTDPSDNPLSEEQQAAKKVKFINTYTNQWNVMLELDLGKMQAAGTFPANGIIYSEVPTRLTNAKSLPYTGDSKKATFNLICEENIYLKGDYNDPASDNEWMPAAIISKKHIYTLSNEFNDPQVSPAFEDYPSYPYVYVTFDGDGNIIEADPSTGAGEWLYYDVFDYYGDEEERRLWDQAYALKNAINSDWQATFRQDDPTGTQLYTVSSSHPLIDAQEWGAMPNRVQNHYTYNCLLASYYYGYEGWSGSRPDGDIPYGVSLEKWENDAGSDRDKNLNGSFFQLDWGDEDDENRFTAHESDGPVDFYYFAPFDNRAAETRPFGGPSGSTDYGVDSPDRIASYDSRFRNKLLAENKPIFFGGGESSWRELSISEF